MFDVEREKGFERIAILVNHKNDLISELRSRIPYDEDENLSSLYGELFDFLNKIMVEEAKYLSD